MARDAARLVIQGRVQGVGYRWWAVGRARELGLAGWVRNCADGTVEALAIGAPEAIAAFARACEVGPAHARVEAVAVAPAADDGSGAFDQREAG
jgi:acylphosphatase